MNIDRILNIVGIAVGLLWPIFLPRIQNIVTAFFNRSREKRICVIREELKLLEGPLEEFVLRLALYLFLTLTFMTIALVIEHISFTNDQFDSYRRGVKLILWILATATASSGVMTVNKRHDQIYKERQKVQIGILESKGTDKARQHGSKN